MNVVKIQPTNFVNVGVICKISPIQQRIWR